jgi:hypothetical protein
MCCSVYSRVSTVNATGPELGPAKLLVLAGDGILDVTCESELKIRPGLKRPYNAEIKRA